MSAFGGRCSSHKHVLSSQRCQYSIWQEISSRTRRNGFQSMQICVWPYIYSCTALYRLHLHRYDLRAGHWKKEFQLSYATEWLKMPSETLSAAGNWELFLPISRTAASARKRLPNKVHFLLKNPIFQVSLVKKVTRFTDHLVFRANKVKSSSKSCYSLTQ